MRVSNIVVLGGGLAGLTVAIHLSKLGYEVTIIEKNNYPKHKVCGEYISNEVADYLHWLGLETIWNLTQPISRFRLEISPYNFAEVNLPLGGFGISRYTLDHILYQKAVALKCQFLHETVMDVKFENNLFTISLGSGKQIQSLIAIGAFGKRSTVDIALKRNFIQKKSHWMAVKAHYEVAFPQDLVGLYPFEGGYCGVSNVENNVVNICYIVQTKVFKRFKNIKDFTENILDKNTSLKQILEASTPIFKNPLTISQISFEKKLAVENHILMVGDTAGLIHPLCGNGMAMAIHSAKIVSELLGEALSKTDFLREDLELRYQESWNKAFQNRLQMGWVLSKLLLNPNLTKICMATVAQFPSVFQFIIKKTHGKLISIPTQC